MDALFHQRPTFERDKKGHIVWLSGPLADFHAATAKILQRINPRLNRKLVKNTNFANIYGAGLIKFAFMIGEINERDYKQLRAMQSARDWTYKDDIRLLNSKRIKADYDQMFPNVAPMLKAAREATEQRGWVKDLVGRRARPIHNANSSLNRVIQGGAASINKRVLVETYKERKRLGLTMRLTVHDELAGTLEGPVGPVKKVLNTQYFPLRAPILWDAKSGNNWAECK
jgi:DNA polymerase I-like protein with 3'-5' exonuclease and polymerase domains